MSDAPWLTAPAAGATPSGDADVGNFGSGTASSASGGDNLDGVSSGGVGADLFGVGDLQDAPLQLGGDVTIPPQPVAASNEEDFASFGSSSKEAAAKGDVDDFGDLGAAASCRSICSVGES